MNGMRQILEDSVVRLFSQQLDRDVLTDALGKTIKLGLPRGIVLRNENYYGKTRHRKR